jgi:hypothetical protein
VDERTEAAGDGPTVDLWDDPQAPGCRPGADEGSPKRRIEIVSRVVRGRCTIDERLAMPAAATHLAFAARGPSGLAGHLVLVRVRPRRSSSSGIPGGTVHHACTRLVHLRLRERHDPRRRVRHSDGELAYPEEPALHPVLRKRLPGSSGSDRKPA